MTAPASCVDDARRRKVAQSATHNGIDYLEVDPADQRVLLVHFLHALPGEPGGVPGGPPLLAGNVVVTGGERIISVAVTSAVAADDMLTVTVDQPGDFSTYQLRLVASAAGSGPPDGFDPLLASVPFSFKVGCPNPFDCRPQPTPPATPPTEVRLDYLARDYAGFRRLLLDRLGARLPSWTDRNPADPVIALVELLAHVGDQLSYRQDAVATEAYLGTARSRVSVRRHARLLDYPMHDGCNARCWIAFEVQQGTPSDGATLPAGTPVLPGRPGDPPTVAPAGPVLVGSFRAAVVDAALVDTAPPGGIDPVGFETVHPLTVAALRSRIDLHTWSAPDYCLPVGSTGATLVNSGFTLQPGDVLILAETAGPATGLAGDADPGHRQAVRVTSVREGRDPIEGVDILDVTWHPADALRFELTVTASSAPGEPPVGTAVALGNVVLADHGTRVRAPLPDRLDVNRFRPALPLGPVTQAEPYPVEVAATRPAADAGRRGPEAALPQAFIEDGDDRWEPRRDLLGSDRFDRAFVVEIERDATARLRFGDDSYGRRPSADAALTAEFRVGNGKAGNVGHDTLRRVVWDPAGINAVTNPLPAFGGRDPETVAEVREFAPQAFRVQRRAVTEADWERAATEHPEVENARARFRWTGSWYTVYLTIDRLGGGPVVQDPAFLADLRDHLQRFRIAGYDLEITGPTFVPLELALLICVAPGYFRSDVQRELLEVFGTRPRGDGSRGFFSPDNFTFGQPLYLSEIHLAAMAVAGVSSVRVTACHRFRRKPAGELAAGYLATGPLEVIRLDNDPSLPERGQLTLVVEGGL